MPLTRLIFLFSFLHFFSFSQNNDKRIIYLDSTLSDKWKNIGLDSNVLKMNFSGSDGEVGEDGRRGYMSYDLGGCGTAGSHGSSGSNGAMGADVSLWYSVKIYEKDTLVFFHVKSNATDLWRVQKFGKEKVFISSSGGKGGNGGEGGRGGGGGDYDPQRKEVGRGGDGGDGGHAGNGGNGGRIQVVTDSISYRYFQHFSFKVDAGLGGAAGIAGSSGSDGIDIAETKGGQIFKAIFRSHSGRYGRSGMNGMSGMNGSVDFRLFPLSRVQQELQ